jgi:hypothetical protein
VSRLNTERSVVARGEREEQVGDRERRHRHRARELFARVVLGAGATASVATAITKPRR